MVEAIGGNILSPIAEEMHPDVFTLFLASCIIIIQYCGQKNKDP